MLKENGNFTFIGGFHLSDEIPLSASAFLLAISCFSPCLAGAALGTASTNPHHSRSAVSDGGDSIRPA